MPVAIRKYPNGNILCVSIDSGFISDFFHPGPLPMCFPATFLSVFLLFLCLCLSLSRSLLIPGLQGL